MPSEVSNKVYAACRKQSYWLITNNAIDNVLEALRSEDPEKTPQDKLDDAIYAWNLGQKKIQAVSF